MNLISAKMFLYFFLKLCVILWSIPLALCAQKISIDTLLGTSVQDCFDRISIGDQLSSGAIYRNISELTTLECEKICKQDKKCLTYDYGVGAKGNATCNLSKVNETELYKRKLLIKHPDYDVFVRRIRCEQAPPRPLLQQQSDDPENGNPHRPVYRPPDDDKRPLADIVDYPNKPKPNDRPINNNDRPDDYFNPKPDYYNPPSYGDHRPQEAPLRPNRPYKNQTLTGTRPDPYDVLYFHDPYARPPRYPQSNRPDPPYPAYLNDDFYGSYGLKPERPYGSEGKPPYQYVNRPSKPNEKPQQDCCKYKPSKPVGDAPRPDPYGQSHPNGPIGPPDYNDNYLQVIIRDPPRPPNYGHGCDHTYGPGGNGGYNKGSSYNQESSYASHSSNSQFQSSNSQFVGTITEIDENGQTVNNRPQNSGVNRPLRPDYGSQNSGYGGSTQFATGQSDGTGYGPQGPQDTNRPAYGSSQANFGSQGSYSGLSQSSGSQASYGGGSQSSYSDDRPLYGNSQGAYDSTQGSYGTSQSGYGSQISVGSQSTYDGSQFTYGGSQSSYGGSQSAYGESQSSYGDNQSVYGSQSSHGGSQSLYGEGQSTYVGNSQSYGSNQDKYSSHSNAFGGFSQYHENNQGYSYGTADDKYRPQYGNQPFYGENQYSPGYGAQGSNENAYGNHGSINDYKGNNTKPNNQTISKPDRPEKPDDTGYKPGYKPNEPVSKPGKPDYEPNKLDRPGYNPDRPDDPGYRPDWSDSSGYGLNRPSEPVYTPYGPDRPGYGFDRPDVSGYIPARPDGPGYGPVSPDDPGYGPNRPSFKPDGPGYKPTKPYDPGYRPSNPNNRPNQYGPTEPSYKPDKPEPNKPGLKPVYENFSDKPIKGPHYDIKPNGQVIGSNLISISDYGGPGSRPPGSDFSYEACFRRVLAGKRALRSHVRRLISCERLEDCRYECASERRFPCESFNYKLDPSFRGKGICELMTKPIEAFDLHRDFVDDKDYDFYERDRNSLEPYCPVTLRGPGYLHSGFLSSKPGVNNVAVSQYQKRWEDRLDWSENRYDERYDRVYNDKRGQKYGNVGYQDRLYVPYQIGISRSDDGQENWAKHGGSYGGYGTYYKNRNDYNKSLNYWKINNDRSRYYGVKPYGETSEFNFDYNKLGKRRGSWNQSYGQGTWKTDRWNKSEDGWRNSLDSYSYDEPGKIHYYEEPRERSDEETPLKDCSSRRRPGMSLSSGSVRRSLSTRNVVQCEAACFNEREFKCVSYSFRYSDSHGSDNCYLSERPYRGLELSTDSGSDVYAMPQDQGCISVTFKPWVESECFWHVRSGSGVSGEAVRGALTVAGLGACEAECIRAQSFFCRGFSFRFDPPVIGDDLENCLLTSSPPTSLEIGHGLKSITGHELYARGNYGRGCEPALYDDVSHKETSCYLQYDKSARLIGSAVRGQARVRDEEACGAACTDAPFRCLSYSFSAVAPSGTENCLLSEIRLFDLQRGVDYQHSDEDWLFAFDLFNGHCWRKVHGKDDDEISLNSLHPISPAPGDLHRPSSGPSGPSYVSGPSGVSGPDYPYIPGSGPPSGPAYRPGYSPSGPDIKPSYPDMTGPGYKPGYRPDSYPSEPSGPDYRPGYIPQEPGYKKPNRPVYRPDYSPDGREPGYIPSKPNRPEYLPEKPVYYPSGPSGPDDRPTYIPIGPSGPEYRRGYPPNKKPYPVQPSGPSYSGGEEHYGYREDLITMSWRHYTVSGFPCRRGTSCAQNQIAGHWACEPEGGEIGSWDYCCAPTHRCGYSEGFNKPWCYVGTSEDQWRPCSEKYYPYHQHKVPHPSQGSGGNQDYPSRPWNKRPSNYYSLRDEGRLRPGPYLSDGDRKYWDDLYKNGPQAYYDKYGNPLPGYVHVSEEDRYYSKYHQSYPDTGQWAPVAALHSEDPDPSVPGGLGVPRYWPVAYLHKGPPPNMTYFKYNETTTTTTIRSNINKQVTSTLKPIPELSKVNIDDPKGNSIENKNQKDEKRARNLTDDTVNKLNTDFDKTTTTTLKPEVNETVDMIPEQNDTKVNDTNILNNNDTTIAKNENLTDITDKGIIKGISGKTDFDSFEVFDIEDAKSLEKSSELKTIEAEERQIEEIGRLLASKRNGKFLLGKRSQKDLESKSIAVDRDTVDFDFGNRFPALERRGTVQRVSKQEIENERNNDKSLEVSETSYVRPPRILSTTENIRKAVVNGKIFYDATIREPRDVWLSKTRRNARYLEESKGPVILSNNANVGRKKTIKPRNVNPVRRVRRVYRKKYNPEEVRKRLLERDRNIKKEITENTRKL